MNQFEIYWDDLTPECQERLRKWLGGENGNYDVFPLAVLDPENVKDILFVSVWDDGDEGIISNAKYDEETGIVFNIDTVDAEGLDVLVKQYVIIDDEAYDIEDNGDGTYTVIK